MTPSEVDDKDCYFRHYADVYVHLELIKDKSRMDAYKSAVAFHSDFIEGKVVLDVGCGTGILSILCAKAGARKVYAVDASEIALQAQSIVKDNNLSDIITVLHGRVEDVTIDEQVDVIISEWMGYMLLQECMLESIVTARNRWLKPSGLLLPSSATLYMAPFTDTQRYFDNIGFWSDVDGIDMSALIPLAKKDAFSTPSVETIRSASILGKAHQVKKIDIYSVSNPELESVTSKFMFKSYISAPLHGFETEFSQKKPKHSGVPSPILSTAPEAPATHWKQVLIDCDDLIQLEKGQTIEGSVTITQNDMKQRFLVIRLQYALGGESYVKVVSFL